MRFAIKNSLKLMKTQWETQILCYFRGKNLITQGKIKEKTQNSKKKLKTQGFGKSIWSSCRKQVQFPSLH